VVVLPLVILALGMGVFSPYFTRYIEPSVDRLVIQLQQQTKPRPGAALTATVAGEGESR
jgi:NADH:ubiquinone oxidoreductase subunit 4 (subunit M)